MGQSRPIIRMNPLQAQNLIKEANTKIKIGSYKVVDVSIPIGMLKPIETPEFKSKFVYWKDIEVEIHNALFAIRESRMISDKLHSKLYNLYWGM